MYIKRGAVSCTWVCGLIHGYLHEVNKPFLKGHRINTYKLPHTVCVYRLRVVYIWKHPWLGGMEDRAGETDQLSSHPLDDVQEHVWLCVVRFLCPPGPFSYYRVCGYSLLQDCVCELSKKLDSLRETH